MSLFFVAVLFLLSVLLARFMGDYMAAVYGGRRNPLDFLRPVENFIFRFCKINPYAGMNWKQYLLAFFVFQLPLFVWSLAALLLQGSLPFNPAGNPSMDWTLAFNSVSSFITSTNLQHYSGESGATYCSQVAVFGFLQFMSAACSLAIGVAIARGFMLRRPDDLGNFYLDFVRSITRVLLPLCLVVAALFALNGVPSGFSGPDTVVTLQGDSSTVARGPVAAFLPIKELGSNGGGFFGANDAHPFENPNLFTFGLHTVIVFLLPMAFVFMLGRLLNQRKFSRILFGIMTAGFLLVTVPIMVAESGGNPAIEAMQVSQPAGSMEGKETRFGVALSAFYTGENSVVPAGTVAAMQDSYLPLSGLFMLFGMQVDGFYGGLGTGWLNLLVYVLLAAFIGSLMIGRTPEVLGKKLSVREIQLVSAVYIIQPLVVLGLTAVACFAFTEQGNEALAWLSNTGPHGFTTMLYEFTSSYAGNGSGFEALGDNTPFWNLTTGIAMLLGRYVPIIGLIAVAGSLSKKVYGAPTAGTLKTDSVSFGAFVFFLILILSGLAMLVSFLLGPLAEHYTLFS